MSGGAWACAHASTGSRLRRIFDSTNGPRPLGMDSGSEAGMTEREGQDEGVLGVGGIEGCTSGRDIRLSNCVGGGVLGRCGWGDSRRLRL